MPSPIIAEGFNSGAFLIREASGFLSREQGTITNTTAGDLALPGGLVLSLAAPTAVTTAPLGTNTGNGTIGPVTVAPGVLPGAYVVNLLTPTTFTVENPDGAEIGKGQVGTALTVGSLTFTVTAGSTAFLVGDAFTITAPISVGSYVPFTGIEPASAILFNRMVIPAGATRKVALMVRDAEVNGSEVQWDPAATGPIQTAGIAALGKAGLVFRQVAPAAG